MRSAATSYRRGEEIDASMRAVSVAASERCVAAFDSFGACLRMMFPKPYADFAQRLRVPAGFVLLVAFAWLSQPSKFSMEVGLPISVLGLLLRAWAAGHLAKNQELATSGPFAYVRNPLYLGTLITAAGLVVAAREVWLVVVVCVSFCVGLFAGY